MDKATGIAKTKSRGNMTPVLKAVWRLLSINKLGHAFYEQL